MRKEEIRKRSSIKTESEAYNEAYKFYQNTFNALPYNDRTLGALGDAICAVREAKIYLESYSDFIPPKLERIIKDRLKNQTKLAIKYYQEISGRKEDLL